MVCGGRRVAKFDFEIDMAVALGQKESAKEFVQVSKVVSNCLYSGSHYPDNFSKNAQKITLFIYLVNCFAEGEVCLSADDRKDFESELSKLDILKKVQLHKQLSTIMLEIVGDPAYLPARVMWVFVNRMF
ncbi:hypothetical protein TURU_099332 [Turdus rufiventris]|nr:hypothetical protein TURU_099332 [Turdus rufiventris]